MKLKYIISFTLIFLFTDIATAQKKNKKDELEQQAEDKAALKEELSEYKRVCRAALKPYRYDGVKTTQFRYKTYEYIKEVEIATIQNAEYRLSYNTNGIHHDKIKMQIYDKSSKDIRRVLLYEKSEIGGNEFSFETNLMIEKLKQSKLDKGIDSVIVNQMRLKKIFVNYIIPAIEKTTEINEFGENVTVKLKGAVILCVGYSNL